MANPFVKPTLTGYDPSPAPDTGAAGGAANVVRWSKHTDEIGNPLRDFANSIADAVETAFENMYGTGDVFMVFMQPAAPPGWTQMVNISDRVLRLTNGTGVLSGGSWTISGLTGPSHTHGAGGLATEATNNLSNIDGEGTAARPTANHTHNITGSTGTAGGGSVSSTGAWRPAYIDVIRAFRSFA